MTSDPDHLLLDQFVRTQDPVAFDQLARRYRAMVFSVARRVTQSHHDAEDVAQSCFLELARKAASIRISIPAFLHATATRRSIDLLRDKNRRRKYEIKAANDRPEPIVDAGSSERPWDEISPEVDQAISRLPENFKTFVILYFLRGLSVADIALETGLNRGMIERRLQVGVRRLRADLAQGNRLVSAGVLAVGLHASSVKAVPASLTAATGRMALAAGLNVHRAGAGKSFRRPRWRWPTWIAPAGAAITTISLIAYCSMHLKSQTASTNPYDEMIRLYAGCLPAGETSGFAFHAAQMKTDASSFWRGSQPLFYEWCKSNCQDWLAKTDDYALCHGSPNLEDAETLATFVNTDNSASLPIQIEMLQGMIIARLATDRNLSGPSSTSAGSVADAMCQAYRASLLSSQSLTQIVPDKADMLRSDQYVDQMGNLKSVILGQQGKVIAFLRPAPMDAGQAETLLAAALSRNSVLRNICLSDRAKVRAVRACVRRDAVVTQGQLLLVVQLADSGTLLELKQQTRSPAELAGVAVRDAMCPAQRVAEDAALLSPSGIAPVSWFEWDNQSFTVLPLDLHPQVYELRKDRWVDPVQAASRWATATAATHRNDPNRAALAAAITPELASELVIRSDSYLKAMQADLQRFNNDPRVARDRAIEDDLSSKWLELHPAIPDAH